MSAATHAEQETVIARWIVYVCVVCVWCLCVRVYVGGGPKQVAL